MSDFLFLVLIVYGVWYVWVAFTRPEQIIEDARERRRNVASAAGAGFSLLSFFLKRRM